MDMRKIRGYQSKILLPWTNSVSSIGYSLVLCHQIHSMAFQSLMSCTSRTQHIRGGVMSGDAPSHPSAVPDSTLPLGQSSALLHFLSQNSTLLPFPNSAPPSSWSSIPLSLPELPWMWNSLCMYTQGWLEVHIVKAQCALSNGPGCSQV